MLSFIDYIHESKSAPLYHGTSLDNVHEILKSGKINKGEHGHTSTSRDRKETEQIFGDEAYFKLDQQKIAHRQKIVPTDWHAGGSIKGDESRHDNWARMPEHRRAESEEAVKGDIPLKHATELVVKKKHWDELNAPETDYEKKRKADVKKYPENAWLVKGLLHKDRVAKVKEFHKNLAKHPHIKLTIKDY